jgi:AcrR family transcriptional regulator
VSGRNGNNTRQTILDAAADLFSRAEFRAVTMDEMARHAGVAKGTLYNYFGSKEALFLELAGEKTDHLLSQLEGVVSEESSAEIVLRKLTIHTFMFFIKYPHFYMLWEKSRAQEPCDRMEPILELRKRLHKLFEMAICRGMTDGEIRPVSPDTAADALMGAVIGTVPRCLYDGIESPSTLREREMLFDLVWEAVRTRQTTASPVSDHTVALVKEES